jgi:FtsP/CotA-like multicopper oxidase with cupredoxin domain
MAMPISATDETKVPHYFGPYPNWANSPQVLSDAIVTISKGIPTPTSVGNPLVERAYATDYTTAPGTLGPVFVVLPNAKLPAGTLQSFQIWNQGTAGASPTTSAGNLFHAYVLRPTAVANEYTLLFDSGELTVPNPTVATGEVATFAVSPAVAVAANDVIGFYGEGIPVDTGVTLNPDLLSTPATADPTLAINVAPAQASTMTLGVDPGFPIYATQDRTYSFAATVTPTIPGTGAAATATVDPKTGGIAGITVTDPGTGYTAPPTVSITSPGVTPSALASATAVLSAGVVTSIAVAEAGFGFTTPAVAITGGGTPSAPATAQASGGVDGLTITAGGSGYAIQPIVEFGVPNAPYCSATPAPATACVAATGTATMNASGVVNGVDVITPGSGYTSAPTVTIWDADPKNPLTDPAAVVATIDIGQIDILSGGAGFDSVPTLAITDSVAPFDKGASATATIAALGAVTDINVTAPGAGYLTPGLKKFVDTLAGLGPDAKNSLDQYIPVAVPDTTTYPGTDYYEIGLVQYRHQFSSQLPATLLRGYVQLSTTVVPGKHSQLTNANLDPAVPAAPIAGRFGVDTPHYLGPTIVATKDRPTRITFRNLLPTGAAGDLFLPVDTSMMGSGSGPEMMKLDPTTKVPMDMAEDKGLVTDGVRNPMCANTPKPKTCFAENRATLHLHGGITPWISDGTPHQWVTPAGEDTAYPKGVSVSNVPDMPDPGPGAETFFYTNQQSARLMFYHDHAWGITRLNVYAGEAAGYLITDDTEKALTAAGGALETVGGGTPLVIQDKTFVPSAEKLAQQDPTWNSAKWGGEGNLWSPHVYMPAQNPGDPSGMSSFGRWMYGPWFWPPAKDAKFPPIANPYFDPACDADVQPFCEPALIPATPNVSVGMEAFNDTPIVNGTAYPKTTVDPKAYRYRVLNAANDRFWNLSWYVADPTTGTLSEVALNKAEVEAAQTDPVVSPTPDTTKSPKGPSWVQIGTEGGFLPAPVVVPAQPTTWITDPTRFDVGNVDQHSLLLAPAERADVIVDFSQYRGKTLILYNDAPAAFPARVPGYDYYTGGPDLSPAGAPTTLPGYGPNTRTIMQVKVSNAAPATAFDRPNTTADRMGALNAAFAHHVDPATGKPAGVFESGQNPVIVGQADYNSSYGTSFSKTGWCNSPTNPSAKCDGYARIAEQGGDTFKFDTLAGPKAAIPLEPKGIHDEMNSANFDEWGRMTANMGLEAPGATPLLQNIILYPYTNPATEVLDATNMPSSLDVTRISPAPDGTTDGTQIWKITHNGVDTHPLHFHLYDVQVINRVTWDNIIIPPEPTELGWKDTVRVSPLEDTIVAVRPIVPTLPFGVPDSIRPLNPMMPIGAKGSVPGVNGAEAGFNNTDANGDPIAPIENVLTNFDWEYVWHCHILSHEEMDMMRPVTVKVPRALPVAPVLTNPSGTTLSWTDATPVDYANPASWTLTGPAVGTAEVGYRIQRAPILTDGTAGTFADIGSALANETTFTIPGAGGLGANAYRVVAWNAAGDSPSNDTTVVLDAPGAPTSVVGTSGPALGQVLLTWSAPADAGSAPITGYAIERSPSTGTPTWTSVATVGVVTSYTVSGLTKGANYLFRVQAVNAIGSGPWSDPPAAARATTTPGAPTGVTGVSATSTSITLSWTPPADNGGASIAVYAVRISADNGLSWLGPVKYTYTPVGNPVATTLTWTGLTPSTPYRFQVGAYSSAGWGTWSAASPSVSTTAATAPSAPLSVTGTPGNATVRLTWQAPASTGGSPITGYGVDYQAAGGSTWTTAISPSAAMTARTYTVTGLTNGTAYVFRVVAANGNGAGPWSATSPAYAPRVTPPGAPTGVTGVSATNTSISLSWTPPADNGGASVAVYAVRISADNGLSWLGPVKYTYTPVGNPVATTLTWTGLTPSTPYRFQVSAYNSAGWGTWSAPSPSLTTIP